MSWVTSVSKQLKFSISIIVVILIVMISLLLHQPSTGTPLNAKLIKGTNYTLYYPEKLRNGFRYDPSSLKQDDDNVSFTLKSESSLIHITEQSLPTSPPDITHLLNFKQLSVLAGTAVIGSENKKPVGLLLTNTTLISIIGSVEVPKDVIADLIVSMKSVSMD